MAAINFDATTVTPNASFDPLPAGWYNANITASEMKPIKDGSGAYIRLELTILDGDYANRKVFDHLNVQNNSQVAQEIAYATLSSICHATGVIQVQDTSQLHGIPLEVKLSVRAASGDYDAKNDVKGYRASSAGGDSARPPVTSQPPAQPQPQGGAGWCQPPAQQAPQENPAWSQPPANHQVPPQTQEQPPVPNQAPAWGQPTQQAQPQAQQQPEQMQTSGQPWPGTVSPTQGTTPSANGVAGTPPWAQP